MDFETLQEAIDQIEQILVKKDITSKDIDWAQKCIQSARAFLFERKELAGPAVICRDTLEVHEDGTISCLESRRVLRAAIEAMNGHGGSRRTLARGLSYDHQVIFCESCQKKCADALARFEEELQRLR